MPALFFDVSDLLGYFPHNRLPTGIQRVQIEIVSSLVGGGDLALCRFLPQANRWSQVPAGPFLSLAAMSKVGGDATAADWLAACAALDDLTAAAPAPDFSAGDVLVNLGTSWWLPDYFAQVRALKADHGVRYAPLIYDFIPLILPQHSDPELVQEFVGWLLGVLRHADFFLAISQATKRDLLEIAGRIGIAVPPDRVGVVPLDADFRQAVAGGRPQFGAPHVLFVSTVEARKNQLGALAAWQALINRHGAERVPQLVLLGKVGFRGAQVLQRIAAGPDLSRRVTVLSGVDDAALAALYRDALFTIYPSFYEGWGLPVTESLCYGRVPLVADNSSLPEAGGRYAIYHPTGSTETMVAELEKLIFDEGHRRTAEARIRDGFRPRSWAEIGGDMRTQLDAWLARAEPARWSPPSIVPGLYYHFVRNRSLKVWPGMGSAEPLRRGGGWLALEDWGCWSRPTGGELEFTVDANGPATLMLELRGLPEEPAEFQLLLDGVPAAAGRIEADARRWITLPLQPEPGRAVRVRLDTLRLGAGPSPETGVGLAGLTLVADERARERFVEAVALGQLSDHAAFAPAP